jgi:hypothetical protein
VWRPDRVGQREHPQPGGGRGMDGTDSVGLGGQFPESRCDVIDLIDTQLLRVALDASARTRPKALQ